MSESEREWEREMERRAELGPMLEQARRRALERFGPAAEEDIEKVIAAWTLALGLMTVH
jgi:hypothetical protein